MTTAAPVQHSPAATSTNVNNIPSSAEDDLGSNNPPAAAGIPPSSKVHPDEITVSPFEDFYAALPVIEPEHQETSYQRFRFRGCAGLRQKLRTAMLNADLPAKTIRRFNACASHAELYHSPSTGQHCIRGDFCKCRTCPPCAAARAKLISTNLIAFLADRQTRMLTLTIKHDQETLASLITRMWASFKLLRKTDEFKQHVQGWAAFLEVKFSSRSGWWHVHLHIICEGAWWDSRKLSRVWHRCTGDSFIVDIQAKGTNRSRAYYASKYASKPFDAGSIPTPELLAEAVRCLHRRKLWQVGGEWKSLRLLDKPTTTITDWVYVAGLRKIFDDANNGNEAAQALISQLSACEEEKVLLPPPDQP